MAASGDEPTHHRLADFFFDYRWPLSLLLAAGLGWLVVSGFGAAAARSQAVDILAGVRPGPDGSPLKVLDPRMDIWFSQEDEALAAFKKIDQGFVGDDFVLLVLQDETDPMGVFGAESLAAIARLTEECLRVPGVRHVRSLTSLPWIRWGDITGEDGVRERGLLVSDLFVGDPAGYDEAARLRRLIDVLGGTKAAALVGEGRVRSLIGPTQPLADIIGEPSSVGTLVSADGRMAAIQIQMIRRRPTPEEIAAAFPVGDPGASVGSELAEAEGQFRTLQGLDRTLRIEAGLARPSPGHKALDARIAAMQDPSERRRWQIKLADRTAAHLQDPDGAWVRLWDEYKREQDGTLTPLHGSPPSPPGWSPTPRSRFPVMTAGTAYFNRNFFEVGQRDIKFVGLMFVVLALALFSVFRTVGGVAGPLGVIFGAILGTVCLTWYLGEFLDNLTAIVPNMLAAVGMGDGVHLMASYALYRSRGGWESPHELVRAVVRANSLPVLLTSVTTAIGFGSLTLAGMIPLVKLGTVAPVGVALAYLLSMTWIPAALSLVPLGAEPSEEDSASEPEDRHAPSPRVRAYVGWVIQNRLAIVASAVLITVVAGVGVLQLVIDSDPRTQLPPGDPLLVQGDIIEARLGGISDVELLFEAIDREGEAVDIDALEARRGALEISRAQGPLSAGAVSELAEITTAIRNARRRRIAVSPEFLGRLTAFVDRLREESRRPDSALALLTEVTSPLDILRKIHQVQNENKPEAYRVPTDEDVAAAAREPRVVYDDILDEYSYDPPQDGGSLVAQYYLQYETGARPGENLSSQIRADRKALRVQGRLHLEGNELTLAAIDRIREIAWEEFPDLAGTPEARSSGAAISSLEITGRALLFAEVGRRFIVTFLESVGVALVLITLVIIGTFRSVRYGLISLIPNVLPIILPLGVLGWIGVPLGPAAALVASIALGVCVDDTIHFFTKYTHARGRDLDVREALEYSLGEVGWALTITTLVLMLGFSALLLSDFYPSYRMGQLVTAMIGLAWVADLLVTPAVLAIFTTGEAHLSTEREDAS